MIRGLLLIIGVPAADLLWLPLPVALAALVLGLVAWLGWELYTAPVIEE